MDQLQFKIINPNNHAEICISLLKQLNPKKEKNHLKTIFNKMIVLPHYIGLGLFKNKELIGFATGWTTIRVYCGKQLEIDNVIIDTNHHSKGYGKWFMNEIESWCITNDYESIELNSYVTNSGSHKFYFNQGFKIIGYHFQKELNKKSS